MRSFQTHSLHGIRIVCLRQIQLIEKGVNQQDEKWKGSRTIRCSVRNGKDSRISRT